MGKAYKWQKIVRTRASWVFAAKIALSLVAVAFAASISLTSNTYQAEIGSVVKVSGNLLVTSVSYFQSSSTTSASSCSVPTPFSAIPGIANTNITSGHWVFDVRVNATATTPINTPFNATFTLGSTNFGPACMKSVATVNSLWIIDCRFDVGATLPPSPYSYKVTI